MTRSLAVWGDVTEGIGGLRLKYCVHTHAQRVNGDVTRSKVSHLVR